VSVWRWSTPTSTEEFIWTVNWTAIYKKGQSRLSFLRRLRSFSVSVGCCLLFSAVVMGRQREEEGCRATRRSRCWTGTGLPNISGGEKDIESAADHLGQRPAPSTGQRSMPVADSCHRHAPRTGGGRPLSPGQHDCTTPRRGGGASLHESTCLPSSSQLFIFPSHCPSFTLFTGYTSPLHRLDYLYHFAHCNICIISVYTTPCEHALPMCFSTVICGCMFVS